MPLVVLALCGCNSNAICMFAPCDAYYSVEVTNPCDTAVEVADARAGAHEDELTFPHVIEAGESDDLGRVGEMFDVLARPAGANEWALRVAWDDIPLDDSGNLALELPAIACGADRAPNLSGSPDTASS